MKQVGEDIKANGCSDLAGRKSRIHRIPALPKQLQKVFQRADETENE